MRSPTTSGAASCPCTVPVEKDHATLRFADITRVDLVESAIAGVGVVFRGHQPLAVICGGGCRELAGDGAGPGGFMLVFGLLRAT